MAYKLSKREIAKKFDLPERKSKIASLLKQDDEIYCICRSSDSSRFMICCDNCEEWYHGDCVGITESDSALIKHYFCDRCQEDDRSLRIVYKVEKPRCQYYQDDNYKPPISSKSHNKPRLNALAIISKKQRSHIEKKCECTNCRRSSDCGECYVCLCKISGLISRRTKDICINRICLRKGSKRKKNKGNISDTSSDLDEQINERSEMLVGNQYEEGMQCFGPKCMNSSRIGSKYCSDECGLKLAKNRLFYILPPRMREWSMSVCVADELARKQLEEIRIRVEKSREVLKLLEEKAYQLDELIDFAKTLPIDSKVEEEMDEESEASIYCITCGHEIHARSAIKHMEKCFSKYESQATFVSLYRTKIEGRNMFCDYYNSTNKTYCKRLKVLCPEHFKEPKVSNTEVCGCPLFENVFKETGQFCQASRKNCQRHHAWEKLRVAEIDMERVRYLMKLDELLEQERQLTQSISNRAGVLSLMLHTTYDHEARENTNIEQDKEYDAALEMALKKAYLSDNRKEIENGNENNTVLFSEYNNQQYH